MKLYLSFLPHCFLVFKAQSSFHQGYDLQNMSEGNGQGGTAHKVCMCNARVQVLCKQSREEVFWRAEQVGVSILAQENTKHRLVWHEPNFFRVLGSD